MALWKKVEKKSKPVVNNYAAGLNLSAPSLAVEDNELIDSYNMCSDDMPAIRTRNDRETYISTGLSNLNGMGKRNDEQLHVVEGNTWKYWGGTSWTNLTTTLSDTEARFTEYNRQADKLTVMWNSTQAKMWDGASTVTNFTSTAVPRTRYVVAHQLRLFALEGNVLNYSAGMLPDDWTTIEASGYVVMVNAQGNGKGITSYGDHVIVFFENSIHELHGGAPENFTPVDITLATGCVSDKTIAEVKGKLLFLAKDGVHIYAGSVPRKVSRKVDRLIEGINWDYEDLCCAGVKHDKYYLSIPYQSTSLNKVLVYDITKDTWHTESGGFKFFTNINKKLYGATDSAIVDMATTGKTGYDDTTAIDWHFETKPYNDMSVASKHTVNQIFTLTEGCTDATMKIDYSTNVHSTAFSSLVSSTLMTVEPSRTKTYLHTNVLQDVENYRLKFSGSGHAKVHLLQKNMRTRR